MSILINTTDHLGIMEETIEKKYSIHTETGDNWVTAPVHDQILDYLKKHVSTYIDNNASLVACKDTLST